MKLRNLRSGVRAGVVALAALGMISVVAGCGADDETSAAVKIPSTLQGLVKAAQKEGAFTLYTTGPPITADNIVKAFEKKYDIPSNAVRLAPGDMQPRFAAEAEAGKTEADVYIDPAMSYMKQGFDKHWLVGLDKAELPGGFPNADYPKNFVRDNDRTAVVGISQLGVALNTKQGAGPVSWEDVLDPMYKGKVAINDPRSTPSVFDFMDFLEQTYGEDYLKGFAAQDPQVYPGGLAVAQAVGAGEEWIQLGAGVSVVEPLAKQGAPIDITLPTPAIGIELYVGVVADAPHPAAARLFADYVLSKEGADVWNAPNGDESPYSQTAQTFKAIRPEASQESIRTEIAKLAGLEYP